MPETAQVTECPFPLHEKQREKIEATAERLGTSETHVFSVVIEEGVEALQEEK